MLTIIIIKLSNINRFNNYLLLLDLFFNILLDIFDILFDISIILLDINDNNNII